ncbi:serpin family protein [Clostridium sp. DL1XJH146]
MRKIKRGILFLLFVIVTVSTGCSINNSNLTKDDYEIEGKVLTKSVTSISKANNKVAFKMLMETINANKSKNTVISPISMNTILSLSQNGAAGDTKEEMLKALELSEFEDNSINESYKNIIANYNSLESIELNMANSIWVQKGLNIEEDFKTIGKENYEATVQNVDFTKKKTLDTINKWIENNTNGKIKDIVKSFDDTSVALINSVYFKGNWLNQFSEHSTSKEEFTNSVGEKKEIDMMKETFSIQHFKGDTFEAIRLPYEDENFGMYIFLPNEEINIENMMKEVEFEKWQDMDQDTSYEDIEIHLPKFKIEFEQELNEMLQGFGMEKAFDSGADFSVMRKENDLYIDLIKQKCFIEIDENGTEAAAVTLVDMDKACMTQNQTPIFMADRPFMYVIADKNTGLILFMGTVNEI